MRRITCANSNGNSITFAEWQFSPFILAHVDGLYSSTNQVSILDNAISDGGDYQGSRSDRRNILLYVCARPGTRYAQGLRDTLRAVFGKGAVGLLTYVEDGTERVIEYYTESIIPPGNGRQTYQISLICPDPWLYDPEYTIVQLARHVPLFQFPHVFKADGEPISEEHTDDVIAVIDGPSDDPLGMILRIRAKGRVLNPSVTNIYRQEHIRLGLDAPVSKPLQLESGDMVEIVSEDRKRDVTLTRRGGTPEKINHYLTDDSVFLRLYKGENVFGYSADDGLENMTLDICYRNRYEGA